MDDGGRTECLLSAHGVDTNTDARDEQHPSRVAVSCAELTPIPC